MLVILVVVATLLAIWRYTLWYNLDPKIALYGMAAVAIATATYALRDTCDGPALPLALAGTTGFVVAAGLNRVPLSSHVVLLFAILGTAAFSPSFYCTLGYGGMALVAGIVAVYCISGGVNLRKS